MKVAIVTPGRFHVLDLARELAALGHDVKFYSFVPTLRAKRFGLPAACSRTQWPRVLPWLLLNRLVQGTRWQRWTQRRLAHALDAVAARRLEPCDVVIAMSGLFPLSTEAARRRYGAKVLIERGSRHILSQKEILDAIADGNPAAQRVSDEDVAAELRDYAMADSVVVPSRHVEASFVECGFAAQRLVRIPYGADLGQFPVSPAPGPETPPTLLMVGNWSRQKGCDILAAAWCLLPGVALVHVGAVGDAPLPTESGFKHFDKVDQGTLKLFYASAHVFTLASLQDGLALVLAQALACGLTIVCTDRTGGEDLKELIGPGLERVLVVPHGDVRALAQACRAAMDKVKAGPRERGLPPEALEALSWRRYGRAYAEHLAHLVGAPS